MNILTVENITKSYGERKLFDDASFFLQEGEKAGVIGINGTGKSTLLKIIAGIEEPDDGRVVKANHVMVGFLPQHPQFEPEDTVLEAVLKTGGVNKEDLPVFTEADYHVRENEAKSMMTRLGIEDFKEKFFNMVSSRVFVMILVMLIITVFRTTALISVITVSCPVTMPISAIDGGLFHGIFAALCPLSFPRCAERSGTKRRYRHRCHHGQWQ